VSKHGTFLLNPLTPPDMPYGSGSDVKKKQRKNICNRFFTRSYYKEGVSKYCDFLPISRYISETIQDMSIVTLEDERNSHAIYQMVNGAISNEL